MTYREQLRDPRWRVLRLQVLRYARFRCQICGAEFVPLDVHHSYYLYGHQAWEYPVGSLIAACSGPDGCHKQIVQYLFNRRRD